MMKAVVRKVGQIKSCGTCEETRGLKNIELIDGVEISNMKELTEWITEADKVINF